MQSFPLKYHVLRYNLFYAISTLLPDTEELLTPGKAMTAEARQGLESFSGIERSDFAARLQAFQLDLARHQTLLQAMRTFIQDRSELIVSEENQLNHESEMAQLNDVLSTVHAMPLANIQELLAHCQVPLVIGSLDRAAECMLASVRQALSDPIEDRRDDLQATFELLTRQEQEAFKLNERLVAELKRRIGMMRLSPVKQKDTDISQTVHPELVDRLISLDILQASPEAPTTIADLDPTFLVN